MPEQRTARPAGPRTGAELADLQASSSLEVYGEAMPPSSPKVVEECR